MAHLQLLILTLIIPCIVADLVGSNFYLETACSEKSGFCVLENECHHPVAGEFKNLCPTQKSEGAICCKDFPQERIKCSQLHNECKEECPKFLDLGQKECPTGKTCCALV